MDRTRIAKVEDVTLSRRGDQIAGTLHLTPHHIIFVHTSAGDNGAKPARPRELWITYPIISFCTLRPTPAASRQPSSIRLRCRDFTFVCFYFSSESKARDVYDSIRAWTCKLGRIEKVYAFTYQPQPPEKDINSWNFYDPMKEWRRMGVGDTSRKTKWRISNINLDYSFSPTYPSLLAVPVSISDNTLNYASRYRSRARIPVLTYLHPVNDCSITRSSQPLVGVRQNRSIQDEKLLAAIFSTTQNERPLSHIFTLPNPERETSASSKEEPSSSKDSDINLTSSEAIEDEIIARLRGDNDAKPDCEKDEASKPVIYGAQQRNMIVDARPTVNAYAMQAVGLGSENMDNYKFATKAYLGIDNIHVMRDSLEKVVAALKDSDIAPLGPNRELLAKSGWLKHISNMLDGASLIARQVGVQHSHVLIHCSDGWDRTSQLSALSQLCLDPYYRTIAGFIALIEKDWLSFGHMFRHRSGFLSSEKWFHVENERIGGRDAATSHDSGAGKGETISGAQKTFESALRGAKGFFNRGDNANASRESLTAFDSDSDQALQSYESDSPSSSRRQHTSSPAPATQVAKKKPEPETTKVKETSPIFHQFLDAVYQLQFQHPTRFEFTERFLRRLLYHLYSCQYGTFLYDNEKARKDANVMGRTRSVWDYFLSRRDSFLNPKYDPVVDDNVRGKERLIFPRVEEVRWWAEIFGRSDEEMNFGIGGAKAREGRPLRGYTKPGGAAADGGTAPNAAAVEDSSSSFVGDSNSQSEARTPVLTGVETAEESVGPAAAAKEEGPRSAESTAELMHRLSSGSTQPVNAEVEEDFAMRGTTELANEMKGMGIASNRIAEAYQSPPLPPSPSITDATDKIDGDCAGTDPASVPLPAAVPSTNDDQNTQEPVADLDTDPLGVGSLTNGTTSSAAATNAAERKTRAALRRQVEREIQ
ncbi:hypothetical protein GJ744_011784 [Endocarpon pusillum]|uniref:Myotubularin phosphatase domain-containing protein n=1 Tax=Endocarpon pusillum TaxID=364733 RepID=A0A8H7AC61_9EURO|nr:hypothetical protein GJ744_011784 [Endocarpon pusillum]